ncbi:zinc finger protein 423 homolog [Pollicipes pollicipes]|uniref:zinc finger protein 423 homolog n=1 Tax=Pollicipes pollicipes TaxID=41117 RepID=UPI001885561A|nr:zinc finger protein 423 homolog [Pollicipes pollicipes]
MTRRKQAKPRAFKPEEEVASPAADVALTPEVMTPEHEPALRPQLFDEPAPGVDSVSCRWCCRQLMVASDITAHLTSECPGPGSEADLSTDTQSTSSEVSLTSGSPGSSAELDSLVTIGTTEATPYKCCFCEQAYPRQTLMKLHEQTHTDQLPFECEYCSHRFKHKRSKDRHVKLHTGEKKFKCKYCPSAYCRSDHLKIHMRTHDSQKPYQCSVCNRGYRTAAALTSHLQKHKDREAAAAEREPQPYRCLKCAATYPTGDALQWSCPYCDRPSRFSNVEALSYHIQTLHMPLMMGVEGPLLGYGLPMVPLKAPLSPIHLVSPGGAEPAAKPLTCMLCATPVSDAAALISHIQFAAAEPLETHLAAHLRVTAVRYACQRCQRSYRTADELQKHLTDRHAQTLYKCTICHSTFDTRVDVQVHFAVSHSDEVRVHSCSACGDEFGDEPAFLRHLRGTHMSAAKSYPCLLCGQHFEQLSAYKQHKICGEAFYVEFQLDRHVQAVHAHELKLNGEARPPPKKRAAGPGEQLTAAAPTMKFPSLVQTSIDVELNPAYPPARHKCNICDDVLPSARTLAEHKLIHCKVVYSDTCAVCKGTVRSATGYQQHMKQHSAPNFPVSCVICQQTLVSDAEVAIHAEFHLRRSFESAADEEAHACSGCVPPRRELYQCLMCQQTYSDRDQIREHIATHLLENASHACNLCQLSFDTPLKLQIHLIEHNFEGCGSYSCYICSAVFTAAGGLQKHMVEHGIEVKPFDCEHCHQRFFFRTELDNHGFLHRLEGSVRRVSAPSPPAGRATTQPATAKMSNQ